MKVLIAYPRTMNTDLEQEMLIEAGFEWDVTRCRTAEELVRDGQGADAFVIEAAPLTRAVLEALPGLRFVTTVGVGVDHVDLAAAEAHGVWVANVPDANLVEVATHALGMALAMIRHLPFYDRSVRAGRWSFEDTGTLRRPSTLTLGIVGLGNIGRILVRLAQPSFARILGHDPYLADAGWPDHVVRLAELSQLFAQSDVVSLHVPMSADNHHLVTRDLLAQMAPGSYVVNCARGELVDIDALIEMLDSGHIAGAGLDVLPEEPPSPDHPILRHPRVMLSPHAAFYSVEADEELRRKAILNVLAWVREGRPPYIVVEGRDVR